MAGGPAGRIVVGIIVREVSPMSATTPFTAPRQSARASSIGVLRHRVAAARSALGLLGVVGALVAWLATPSAGSAHQLPIATTTLAETRVTQLPSEAPAFRVETYPTRAEAEAAAGPTGLVAELDGKVYLVTLAAGGGSSAGANVVAEIGPLEPPSGSEYLLRLVELTGAPGSQAAPHTHPGAESYYVLTGELGVRTPTGVLRAGPGDWLAGPAGGTPIQPFNAGSSDLQVLVMFAVDAAQPFSSPAMLQETRWVPQLRLEI
jgi:quercetin dioxygenase-like cupin family protein